jgi:hypothetical protein
MRHALLLPAMLLTATLTATGASAQRGTENRCGWYENPTPANHWLTDRTRTWTIGTQGGFQARGIDRIGEAPRGRWVATHPNGSYGYGCACAQVRTNPRNGLITQIMSWRYAPLAQCRGDRRLREPRN